MICLLKKRCNTAHSTPLLCAVTPSCPMRNDSYKLHWWHLSERIRKDNKFLGVHLINYHLQSCTFTSSHTSILSVRSTHFTERDRQSEREYVRKSLYNQNKTSSYTLPFLRSYNNFDSTCFIHLNLSSNDECVYDTNIFNMFVCAGSNYSCAVWEEVGMHCYSFHQSLCATFNPTGNVSRSRCQKNVLFPAEQLWWCFSFSISLYILTHTYSM